MFDNMALNMSIIIIHIIDIIKFINQILKVMKCFALVQEIIRLHIKHGPPCNAPVELMTTLKQHPEINK